jgi:nucleoside-diphosphate-sugar epimerase
MSDPTSTWRGRRVLVTGCTGFLGGAVVAELLARGAEVVGLVRDRLSEARFARHGLAGRVHVIHGLAEDTFRIHSALAVYEVGAVFHLAATDRNRVDRGTPTVLEAVRRYDPRTPVVVARKPDAAAPASSPIPLGVAQFGELFGPGDRSTDGVIPSTITALLAGCHGPTTDAPARDFVHVADAARACVMLSEAVREQAAPLVTDSTFRSGWLLTGREMAKAVRDVLDGHPALNLPTRSIENPLAWSPALKFADALADTVEWCRGTAQTRAFGPKPADPPRRAAA